MTTTKATMIAITKHETHSYYVIILTFSPVILYCNLLAFLMVRHFLQIRNFVELLSLTFHFLYHLLLFLSLTALVRCLIQG